jgi:peptidoglycan hydrolase-like amidase
MLSLRGSSTFLPKGSSKAMRRLTLPVVVLLALVFVAGAAASPVFVLRGHGWGHGVGMSQWGAQGKALKGVGYHDILDFYYPGTALGAPGQTSVRVLLVSSRSSVQLSSDGQFKVGAKRLAAHTIYTAVPTSDGKIRIVGVGKFGDPVKAVKLTELLRLNGSRYRGALELRNESGRLAVVNIVGLQGYLYSVVPREMPSWFEAEALKAQSVAARSYAVRAQRTSWFDLYADTRDQVYGGFESGEPASAVAAVNGTAGVVLRFGGVVAQAFFSASNGGVTAASVDTWGGNVPYLTSKNDPDDLTPGNPNRSWTVRLSASALQSRLHATKIPTDAVVTGRASGRVTDIRLERPAWSQSFPASPSTLGPEWFRSVLRIKSSVFRLGVLNILPSRTKSVCGGLVRLNVIARSVGAPTLQQRPASGGSWSSLALTSTGGGTYTAVHKPCRGTVYRLTSPVATGADVKVKVAPLIVFDDTQPSGGGALRGKVRPLALAGQTVRVERRRSDGTWRLVGTGTVKADGTWRAAFHVTAAVYRARITPPSGLGLVAGMSPPLTITFG